MADQSSSEARLIPEYMLTTFDNPFHPFTQFEEWLAWDTTAGYHTAGLLARLSKSSPDISDVDQYNAVQDAIDEVVRENVSGMHRKIKREDSVRVIDVNKSS